MNDQPVSGPQGPLNAPDSNHYRVAHYLNGGTVPRSVGSDIGQGLAYIGYGLMAIAIAVVIATVIVVTYLNGQS